MENFSSPSLSVICLSIYLLMLFEDVSCAEDCRDDPTDIIGRAWWRQNNVMKMFQSTHRYFQQDLDLIHSSVDYDDRKKKDSLTLDVFVVIWFVRLSIVTQQVIDFRERLSCIDYLRCESRWWHYQNFTACSMIFCCFDCLSLYYIERYGDIINLFMQIKTPYESDVIDQQ